MEEKKEDAELIKLEEGLGGLVFPDLQKGLGGRTFPDRQTIISGDNDQSPDSISQTSDLSSNSSDSSQDNE